MPELARTPVRLSELARGEVGAVLTSAGELPGGPGPGVWERVVGVGDRRDVVLGARSPLAGLGAGRAVRVQDLRSATLLRAHHPSLHPVESGRVDAPSSSGGDVTRIVPLWPDPTVEVRGELLESGSWLPGAGQGIALLLAPSPGPATPDRIPGDAGATAVLALERAVAATFPGVVTLVRGWVFGDWLGLDALLLGRDGRRAVRGRVRGRRETSDQVAGRMVHLLRGRGADHLAEPDGSSRLSSFQVST